MYRKALGVERSFPALHQLGVLLSQQGRPQEACLILEEAVSKNPQSAETERELGAAYQSLRDKARAADHFQRSIEINPAQPNILYRLFQLLTALQAADRARDLLIEVTTQKPEMAPAFYLLAYIHFYSGQPNEAQAAIRRAIAIEPKNCMNHRVLSLMKTYTPDDPDLLALESLHRDEASLPLDQIIALRFALAKAYGDIGEHNRRFDELLTANRLVRSRLVYNENNAKHEMDRLKSLFTADMLKHWAGKCDTAARPIFVLGMPRSGTTLTEQIVARHPDVESTGENTAFPDAVGAIMPNFINEPAITVDKLEALAQDYVRANSPIAGNDKRTTDKMLGNVGLVGLIHLAFPNAKFIHVVRNPVDTCLSCFSTKFGGDQQAFSYDLRDLGGYYRIYKDLMAHWRQVLPEGVLLRVNYEELVADQRGQTERLLAHCGLSWDDSCLAFEKSKFVNTASAGQVRQSMNRKSIGRWRPEARLLQPLLDGLGRENEH